MNAILDTLAASRKLEQSGMPEPQSDAVVEVVQDAMNDLVTKEYFTAELDKRFTGLKSDMDRCFGIVDKRFGKVEIEFAKVREEAAKSHKSVVFFVMGSTLTLFATQLAMLAIMLGPLFGGGAAADAGGIGRPARCGNAGRCVIGIAALDFQTPRILRDAVNHTRHSGRLGECLSCE